MESNVAEQLGYTKKNSVLTTTVYDAKISVLRLSGLKRLD